MKENKICKGINKAHGYAGCGKPTDVKRRKYGLCPSCLIDWATTNESGKIWYQTQFIPKVKKITEKEQRKKTREERESIINYREKLQTEIQKIARLIDIGLPCLALGYHPDQMHGGHIYSKGSNKTMALNLHNIHRQSAKSNWTHNDDGLLREKLVEEYGYEYHDFISGLRKTPALHYTNMEYKDFYRKACKASKFLKQSGQTFNKEERIIMRNRINLELGIYDKEFSTFNIKEHANID